MSGSLGDGWWAQRQLQFANDTWNVTIPPTLQQGAYLFRTELISLHIPFVPEYYPECAHFYVKGSGSERPPAEYLASIPGVWDPKGKESSCYLLLTGELTVYCSTRFYG
jgi:hypothetical protein